MKIIEKVRLGDRGKGRLFKYEGVSTWNFSYYQDGKEHRVSTGETDFKKAKAFAKARIDAVTADRNNLKDLPTPTAAKTTVNDLLDAYMTKSALRGLKGLAQMKTHVKPVAEHFGLRRADDVTSEIVDKYIERLQKIEGKANATINRRVQILSAAFKLAKREWRFTKLSEKGNERRVCYEAGEFDRVLGAAPDHLKGILRFYHATGWRKTSVIGLRWEHVDLAEGTLILPDSKPGRSQIIAIAGDLVAVMEHQAAARKCSDGSLSDYVFHREGAPLKYFRRAWCSALVAAGFPPVKVTHPVTGKATLKYPRTIHDFRRTTARDLVRSGVAEGDAMAITGHSTRAIFDRYNYSTVADIKAALEKRAEAAPRPTLRLVASR